MVPFVLVGTFLLAAVTTFWPGFPGIPDLAGLPGLILLPIGLMVAAFIAPPTILTGRKDASGYPTAATPAEQVAMNRYRMWGELKWRTFAPSTDWLPGWPVRLWWLVSVLLAAAAATIPTIAVGEWGRLLNAAGVFIFINSLNGSLRRWSSPDDPCPGPTLDFVIAAFGRGPRIIVSLVAAVFAGAAVFVGGVVAIDYFDIGYLLTPVSPWMPAAALAATAAVSVITLAVRAQSLEQWRTMVRVRAEWEPRWQITKLEPAPRLIGHEEHGSVQVDSFETHPSLGSLAVYSVIDKINASMGGGSRIAVLESPNQDSQGQPIEGTTHPLRFRIVTFVGDDMPDITDPTTDPVLIELLIASGLSWLSDREGVGRWIFLECQPLHETSDPEPTEDDDEEASPPGTAAWVATFAKPGGPEAKYLRDSGHGHDIASYIGGEVLIDHRNDELFFGALTQGTTNFQDPAMEKNMRDLELTDVWAGRWTNILKMGAIQPRPEHAVFREAKLGAAVLYQQPFVVQQGIDPLEFFKLENKISTTLQAAPFVAVTGYAAGSNKRDGERHPQAFAVTWSAQQMPANPDTLTPTDGDAPKWVLAGRINAAFDAARLDRPEVYAVKCLTDRKSRGHIWEMKLRLYGSVQLSDVRAKAQLIRQHMGSGWLRVAQAKDGCVIVAGVDPTDARGLKFAGSGSERPEDMAREKEYRDYVTSLDWEQAFSDAKVVSAAGFLPKLIGTGTLPKNEDVQVLDFQLPTGTDRTMVKIAVPKLAVATRNGFVEPRPGIGGADTIRLLVSPISPLPDVVGVDWDAVDLLAAEGSLPFATSVEGEPVTFNPKRDPHALVVGATGGGKSVSLQVLIYPALVSGADLYVIDPTKAGADFRFAEPYAKAFAATVPEAEVVMKAVYSEVLRRKNLNAEYAVGNYRELPDEVRPNHVYVVMDEFTSLMQGDHVSRAPSDDPEVEFERQATIDANNQKAFIGTMAGKIAREARSAGVTLVLATQKLTAKSLDDIPGASDLKTNLARMLMGNATYGEKMSALKSPEEAPDLGDVVPKGRGLWESTEANAQVIQVWFETSQESFALQLAERRTPLADSEKLNVSAILEKHKARDEPVLRRPPPAPDTAEIEEVVVGEFEFTLDDLDLEPEEDDDFGVDPAASRAAGRTAVLVSPGTLVDAATRSRGTVMELPDSRTSEDETSGWWKIDAALRLLAIKPSTAHVIWIDPEIENEDELGVPHSELASDVFSELGLSFVGEPGERATTGAPAPEETTPDYQSSAAPQNPVAAPELPTAPESDAPLASPPSADATAPAPNVSPANESTFDEPDKPRQKTVYDELF